MVHGLGFVVPHSQVVSERTRQVSKVSETRLGLTSGNCFM